MKVWLKGGLIGLVLALILLWMLAYSFYSDPLSGLIGGFTSGDGTAYWILLVPTILGAIIGLIVGKVKSRKQPEVVK